MQKHNAWKHAEPTTSITALEFIYTNSRRSILGSKSPNAKILTADELTERFGKYHRYRRYENVQNMKGRIRKTRSPYDERGVHVLCDVKSFRGFTTQYDGEGIYAIGLITEDTKRPGCRFDSVLGNGTVFGYGSEGCQVSGVWDGAG
ncbi:hypothetical protein BDW74DRAFT_103506 [Aspergillus multicolor]|uniref:uncharacterized protein n=1 Tax=Aspergillus multicolor TaxID=41759 RepID=UPI003CCE49AB